MKLLDKLQSQFEQAGSSVGDLLTLSDQCRKTLDEHVAGLRARQVEVGRTVARLHAELERISETAHQFDGALKRAGSQQAEQVTRSGVHAKAGSENVKTGCHKVSAALHKLLELAQQSNQEMEKDVARLAEGFAQASLAGKKSEDQVAQLQKQACENLVRSVEPVIQSVADTLRGADEALRVGGQLAQSCAGATHGMVSELKAFSAYTQFDIVGGLQTQSGQWKDHAGQAVRGYCDELHKQRDSATENLSQSVASVKTWLASASAELDTSMDAEVAPAAVRVREATRRAAANAQLAGDVCQKIGSMLPGIEALHQGVARHIGKGR